MTDLKLEDAQSISFVADRAHIDGAELSALAADGGAPAYWSAGVQAFRESTEAQFLLMRASSPDDRVCVFLCRDRAAFLKAFAVAAGLVPEGTPVMWVCDGNEETHAMLGELLGEPMSERPPFPMLPNLGGLH